MHVCAPAFAVCPCFCCTLATTEHRTGTDTNAALCFRSLLSNLRKLTLDKVAVSLPALQPAATRLCELKVSRSRLQGSADSFLTKGWTTLTALSLTQSRMDKAMLTSALDLPALEDVHIWGFTGYRGGELQLDQLTGSCLQISRLEFQLGSRFQQATEASLQSCRLLNLKRLAELHVMSCSLEAKVDLDLPPSLIRLELGGDVDFFWALQEAAKCAGRGAQLQSLICDCAVAHLQPAQWGASLEEQHRRLGGQLGSLRELEVWGNQQELLSAVGAVASAAPSLVRLEINIMGFLIRAEVSPIRSASLESITVDWGYAHRPDLPAPQLLLTLLPGCTRLREVVIHFLGRPVEGAAVKIHCHCGSQRCIVPEEVYAGIHSEMLVVKFVRPPSSEQGVRECTVLHACHAAGPEQAPLWGRTVMPGIL